MSKLVFLHTELEKIKTKQPESRRPLGSVSEAPGFWKEKNAHRGTWAPFGLFVVEDFGTFGQNWPC